MINTLIIILAWFIISTFGGCYIFKWEMKNYLSSPKRSSFKIKAYWIVGNSSLLDSNLINKLLRYKDGLQKECTLKRLSKFGFQFLSVNQSVSGGCWVNSMEKVIIKTPYLIDLSNAPKLAVPTLIIELKKPFIINYKKYNHIFIQPLVDVSKGKEIEEKIASTNGGAIMGDCHSGNLGIYKETEVQIDW